MNPVVRSPNVASRLRRRELARGHAPRMTEECRSNRAERRPLRRGQTVAPGPVGPNAAAKVRSPRESIPATASIPAASTRRRTRAMTVTWPARSNRSVSGNVSPCTNGQFGARTWRDGFSPAQGWSTDLAGMTIPSGTGAVSRRPFTRNERDVPPTHCATGVVPPSRRSSSSLSFLNQE